MTWANQAAFALIILAMAELIWRCYCIHKEYRCFLKHYALSKCQILKYGFHFTTPSFCILSAAVAIAIAIVSSQNHGVIEIYEKAQNQSYLLIIWWIFRYTQFTKSMFDYAEFIRSNSGLDYATGMAVSYFHGYLYLVLPSNETQKGIVERIEDYELNNDVEFAIKRLIILIPNSLHSRPIIESKIMEREKPLECAKKDRAGVSRSYQNDVYRIRIDGSPYYIAVEGATPLLTFFEALQMTFTCTNQMMEMKREILIKFYRHLKKILESHPLTQGQCEVVFYNDYTADGRPQDVGEVLATHLKGLKENSKRVWKRELI